MPRKLRVEYPGAIYHVMNRGDRREPIFRDDADRQRFVNTLDEACGKTAQVHALCLLLNHFLQVAATRLVFGGGGVPEGVVGADEEANGSRTLWGGAQE